MLPGLWSLFAASGAAWFLIPCWPLSVQRIDPIVSPGGPSGHVHQIIGGSALSPSMSFEDTQTAQCTTCFVAHDRSNYWIPALYFEHQDGTFERVEQVGSASVYYFNDKSRAGPLEELEPFPPGFRMVVGDPTRRSTGSDQTSQALNYKCLDYSGSPLDSKSFPDQNCPDGIRAELIFPSCWDGHNLDSPDHKSHVAFPLARVDAGACPESHPRHLVVLQLEFIFDTNRFADEWSGAEQPFRWAHGDHTGFGLHGDFLMGWEENTLRAAVSQCHDTAGLLDRCPPFAGLLPPEDASYVNPGTCTVDDFVHEDVGGLINKLPGINPVQQHFRLNHAIVTDLNPSQTLRAICSSYP